jgi:hypothetical protein
VWIRHADNVASLYPQKLALTSLTSGGRSVCIVRTRTQATEIVFVCLNSLALCHKETWKSGDKAPPFLTSVSERSDRSASHSCRFIPQRALGTHWIGGWVGPRDGLDGVVKSRILHWQESDAGRPARCLSLYRLSYPDSRVTWVTANYSSHTGFHPFGAKGMSDVFAISTCIQHFAVFYAGWIASFKLWSLSCLAPQQNIQQVLNDW